MILAQTRNGDQLLTFQPCEQPMLPASESHIPLPLALVVARQQGKVLFIFNNRRQVWELPGGMIDEGETPEAAAIRELHEETGQIATELRFIGLAKFRLKPNDRLEFGAIYACELVDLQPFQPNAEAGAIMWWDLISPVEAHVTEIDLKLADLALEFFVE
jgi:8-oxo-dGTP diphosphatase